MKRLVLLALVGSVARAEYAGELVTGLTDAKPVVVGNVIAWAGIDAGIDAGTDAGVDAGVSDAGVKLGPCRDKQTICFSPGGNCHLPLIDVIDRTQARLDVAIYALNHAGIADAIIRAKARGVSVRVIVDSTQYKSLTQYPLMERLAVAKVAIRRDAHAGIMHLKLVVADSREFGIGSFNYTRPAVDENDENLLVWECPRNAVLYADKFDKLWAAFKDVVIPLDAGVTDAGR